MHLKDGHQREDVRAWSRVVGSRRLLGRHVRPACPSMNASVLLRARARTWRAAIPEIDERRAIVGGFVAERGCRLM